MKKILLMLFLFTCAIYAQIDTSWTNEQKQPARKGYVQETIADSLANIWDSTQVKTYTSNVLSDSNYANKDYVQESIKDSISPLKVDIDLNNQHRVKTDNPHNVTKSQIGLGNVDNTSDLNKPISTATQIELNKKAEAINGLKDAKSDSSSVFLGYLAGANDDGTDNRNVAVGRGALNSNTTGNNNTANGYYALNHNTTGNNNTANGYYALNHNTTGYYNTANGAYSLNSNTTGNYNVANGAYSLNSNTIGHNNTANGYAALNHNTTGYYNTANGYAALNHNTTGYYNTANGYYAGYDDTTGTRNSFFGYNTGLGIGSGSGNTIIGANQTGLPDNLTNEIRISDGNGDVTIGVSSDNKVTIDVDGNFSHGTYDFNVQNGSAISGANAGGGWQTSSDSTLKTSIVPITQKLERGKLFDKILKTKVYSYKLKKESLGWKSLSKLPDSVDVPVVDSLGNVVGYTKEKNIEKIKQKQTNKKAIRNSKIVHLGFMAQTFNRIFKRQKQNVVIDWSDVTTIEWYAIQELIKKVRNQNTKINELESRITALENK